MNNYIPFLKFKINEIAALASLTPELQAKTYPFLDFAKKKGMSEASFLTMIAKARIAFNRHLKNFPAVFLDNFDIDDSIKLAGRENYSAVIEAFGEYEKFVPVIGLDRPEDRNDLVFRAKAAGLISSSTIALRLQPEDFQSFAVVEDEILEFQRRGAGLFNHWTIVLDNRFCAGVDSASRINQINNFLANASGKVNMNAVIVAGSSLPASISELMKVLTDIHHPRHEISIYRGVVAAAQHPSIYLGDYTVVSPLYSDLDIPAEAMQNVIAAKTIYSHGDVHYIVRGGALKTHARKRLQYNDIAGRIVAQVFYRGPGYSAGDLYLDEKARFIGSGITPGSILKPTINAHINYMFKGFLG